MLNLLTRLKINEIIYFAIIVAILALMDGFNFSFEHNRGFWSLTYGPDRFTILGKSADIWHVLKMGLLAMIGYKLINKSWLNWVALILVAYFGQLIIYTYLIKEVLNG